MDKKITKGSQPATNTLEKMLRMTAPGIEPLRMPPLPLDDDLKPPPATGIPPPESVPLQPSPMDERIAVPLSSQNARDDDQKYFLGLVRDIRAEAQNLQESLSIIKKKSELTDKQVRALELRASLEESNKIFDYNRNQINERFTSIRSLLDRNSQLYDWAGDEITQLENYWERACLGWTALQVKDTPFDEDKVLNEINRIDKFLDRLIFHSGLLTIPSRVNLHMRHLRIGQPLDFHDAFKDEMPAREDRVKILRYLKSHPDSVTEGIVNA